MKTEDKVKSQLILDVVAGKYTYWSKASIIMIIVLLDAEDGATKVER